jgi:hypothetical protein
LTRGDLANLQVVMITSNWNAPGESVLQKSTSRDLTPFVLLTKQLFKRSCAQSLPELLTS